MLYKVNLLHGFTDDATYSGLVAVYDDSVLLEVFNNGVPLRLTEWKYSSDYSNQPPPYYLKIVIDELPTFTFPMEKK